MEAWKIKLQYHWDRESLAGLSTAAHARTTLLEVPGDSFEVRSWIVIHQFRAEDFDPNKGRRTFSETRTTSHLSLPDATMDFSERCVRVGYGAELEAFLGAVPWGPWEKRS